MTLLDDLRVSAESFAPAWLSFGRPEYREGPPPADEDPPRGWVDAQGQCWEAVSTWPANRLPAKEIRTLEARIRQGRAGGYQQAIFGRDGRDILVERLPQATSLIRWHGLIPAGDWIDQSAAGCPWQFYRRMRWVHPATGAGAQRTEYVMLYLRWRQDHILDPAFPRERELWTGRVYRYDADARGLGGFLDRDVGESPNLLPTDHPDDVAAMAPSGGLLARLRQAPTALKPGFTEVMEDAAKRALCEAAHAWLQNGPSWVYPKPPPAPRREGTPESPAQRGMLHVALGLSDETDAALALQAWFAGQDRDVRVAVCASQSNPEGVFLLVDDGHTSLRLLRTPGGWCEDHVNVQVTIEKLIHIGIFQGDRP